MNTKSCPRCGSKKIKKNGHVNGVQRYKCWCCGHQFLGGKRLDDKVLWSQYVHGKQTYKELGEQYGCSAKTIQRHIREIDAYRPVVSPRMVIVAMDTTYWGRSWGVMLFKDTITGQNLLKYWVKSETIAKYKEGIECLISHGFIIAGIVCDGRRGIYEAFPDIPIQMCQFHQQKIVTRYLTSNPKTEAAKELRKLSQSLTSANRSTFENQLDEWHTKWESYINHRTKDDDTGRSWYTHKKLRSAFFSIKRNLPHLFVFESLACHGMPNTTNIIDGHFSELKRRLRCHNGLSEDMKKKFIEEFLQV